MRASNSRRIDVSRAKRPQRTRAVQSGAARSGEAPRAAAASAGTRPQGQRTGASRTSGRAGAARTRRAGQARKKKKAALRRRIGRVLGGVLCLLLVCGGALYLYVSHKLNSGNSSVVNSGITAAVPPELTVDQMNILVLGLDYTESDSGEVNRSKENPQADMILYVQYDKKAKTIKMLQIPRDVYVGPEFDADGTGKINGVYSRGPNQENRIQNIVAVLNDMLQLEVDHWITIDMESLREMVDVFGGGAGIPINLPYDIVEYTADGQVAYALPAGEHNLKGDDLEFFLRARKAEGMYRGDIDRLDNQKLFYSALFNYMRTMSWQEMVKLMPFFLNYVETDISPLQCAALGVSVLGVPNENIIMGRLPVILSSQAYYTPSSQVVPVAIPQTVECLNTYFRPAEAPVTASQLNIPVLYGLTEPVVDCDMKHIGDNGTVADGAGSADAADEADAAAVEASSAA